MVEILDWRLGVIEQGILMGNILITIVEGLRMAKGRPLLAKGSDVIGRGRLNLQINVRVIGFK